MESSIAPSDTVRASPTVLKLWAYVKEKLAVINVELIVQEDKQLTVFYNFYVLSWYLKLYYLVTGS